jgi:hypothetical protein
MANKWFYIRHEDTSWRLYWGGPSQGWVVKDKAEAYTREEQAVTELPRNGVWEEDE